MTDYLISDLADPANPLDGTELAEILQAAVSAKVSLQDIANLAKVLGGAFYYISDTGAFTLLAGDGLGGVFPVFEAHPDGNVFVGLNNFAPNGSLGILGVPDPSAAFDVVADGAALGSLPAPRMTTAQREAIASPAVGLQVFDTDLDAIFVFGTNGWRSPDLAARVTEFVPGGTSPDDAPVMAYGYNVVAPLGTASFFQLPPAIPGAVITPSSGDNFFIGITGIATPGTDTINGEAHDVIFALNSVDTPGHIFFACHTAGEWISNAIPD